MGLVLSAVALVAGALSANDQLRRCAAVVLVAAAAFWLRRQLALRDVPDFSSAELLGLAMLCTIPFAVDGHAQSNVFVAIAPLGGVAALCGEGRAMALFAATWILA